MHNQVIEIFDSKQHNRLWKEEEERDGRREDAEEEKLGEEEEIFYSKQNNSDSLTSSVNHVCIHCAVSYTHLDVYKRQAIML